MPLTITCDQSFLFFTSPLNKPHFLCSLSLLLFFFILFLLGCLVLFVLHSRSSSIFIIYLKNIKIVEFHIKKLPSTRIHGLSVDVSTRSLRKFSHTWFINHYSITCLHTCTFFSPYIIINHHPGFSLSYS